MLVAAIFGLLCLKQFFLCRFKQIKEQEARRRKQIEEERRLKEAETVSLVINDQQNLDNKLVEKKIEQVEDRTFPSIG